MRSFDPSQESRAYRQALGRYPTGVTVVTTVYNDVLYGITANSFASVSLDPPLILWSPDKSSGRYEAFVKARHFAVHILSDAQRNICDGFARAHDAFSEFTYEKNSHGIPILDDCLSVLECEHHNCFDGGDHSIVLGHVRNVRYQDGGHSLVFAHGKFVAA